VRAETPKLESPRVKASILNRRIEKYASQGLTRAAILERLLAARWPLEQLRPRFPEIEEGAFQYPPIANAATGPPFPTPAVSKAPPCVPTANTDQRANAMTAACAAGDAAAHAAVSGISFQYVPLIQCSFPHADPKHASTFTRKNGWLELTLGTTRPDAGLPYGVPARLLTIYCTSEAVRTNSPEIYLGDSVHDFLRRLDVPITRGARGSLSVYANQLLRLIHSTLSIDENIRDGAGRQGLHMRQALFVEEARLWWDDPEHSKKRNGAGRPSGRSIGNGSSLMLSSVLFHSILERSAPLATSAIKQLRKSPMDLDVYAWLVHRLFHLSKPSMVSWEQLSNQFGHNYGLPRKFRHFFLDSLKRVSAVYPEAKLQISESGVLLLPSRPHLANTRPSKR
jgi:Plasmid encoded RepA protein